MDSSTPGRAILIVEDNTDIRETFRTLFELEGYDVQVAVNGEDALAKLERNDEAPALILLDLSMPVMNGWEFLDALRASDDGARIPVTVLSANVDAEISRDLRARYGCRVLGKPASAEALLNVARDTPDGGTGSSRLH